MVIRSKCDIVSPGAIFWFFSLLQCQSLFLRCGIRMFRTSRLGNGYCCRSECLMYGDFGIFFLWSLVRICFITSKLSRLLDIPPRSFMFNWVEYEANLTWYICPGRDAYSSPTFCGVSFSSTGALEGLKNSNNKVISYQTMSIRNPRFSELVCASFHVWNLPHSPHSACSDGNASTWGGARSRGRASLSGRTRSRMASKRLDNIHPHPKHWPLVIRRALEQGTLTFFHPSTIRTSHLSESSRTLLNVQLLGNRDWAISGSISKFTGATYIHTCINSPHQLLDMCITEGSDVPVWM